MVGSYFTNTPSWAGTKSGTGTWGLGRETCVWDVGRMGWDVGTWGHGDGDMGMGHGDAQTKTKFSASNV